MFNVLFNNRDDQARNLAYRMTRNGLAAGVLFQLAADSIKAITQAIGTNRERLG